VNYIPSDEVREIRDRIDHPVIDSDGHLIEYIPLVRDFIAEDFGEDLAAQFDRITHSAAGRAAVPSLQDRRRLGIHAAAVWALPTRHTLDRATAMLPDLMYRRLDELGIDFAVLYPTYGLTVTALGVTELRCALARGLNRYYAEAYAHVRDRLEPVAAIPMFTPEEAIAELDYAVGELGLKAVMMGGAIPRPTREGGGPGEGHWIDTLGHDSMYDYDPVWWRCEELGVAPTFHAGAQGWGSRMSTTNNSYNQVGNFATADEATCRSLVFGGVPMRFPNLRFAFQEGGVAWAAQLLAGILGHWDKRNIDAIQHNNPANLDTDLLRSLFEQHARGGVAERVDRLGEGLAMLSDPDELDQDIDMFAESLVTSADDIIELFATRFFYGCEADDPMNTLAFASHLNPGGATLPAIFSSDVGHWDVRDMREVLPEAYELVGHGQIDEGQFRSFVFTNPIDLWTSMNPEFFTGTSVEGPARDALAARPDKSDTSDTSDMWDRSSAAR
jgi:predicted TIM-barrel fold metal-dependent hydrolase